MSRKVEPPRRDQTAWIVGPAPGGEWISKERVAEIAKKHNIRGEYDLHTALDHAITWYLLETSRQKDGPTLEQSRRVFQQIDEHTAALESIVANLPFSLHEQITQHGLAGWKSRLLDEVRALRAAVAPLSEEANKPAKTGPDPAARDHFLEKLICAYEEGTEQPAKVYWLPGNRRDDSGRHGGEVLRFAMDCLDLLAPVKEINKKGGVRIVEKNEAGTTPCPFVSESALAQALQKLICDR